MKVIFGLLFLLAVSWNIQAGDSQYSIQIAASKAPNLADFGGLLEFGSPYTENTDIGLVRVKVGSFNSRLDAEEALEKVRNKGFKDAFITTYSGNPVIVSEKKKKPMTTVKASYQKELVDPEATKTWSKLTDEQKSNVVYLDGILHMRVDGDFVPLSNY